MSTEKTLFTPGPWVLSENTNSGCAIEASVAIGVSRIEQEQAAQKGENIQPIYHVDIKPLLSVNEDGGVTVQLVYESWRQFPSVDFKKMQKANCDLMLQSPAMYKMLEKLEKHHLDESCATAVHNLLAAARGEQQGGSLANENV